MHYYFTKQDAKLALEKKIIHEVKIFLIIFSGIALLALVYLAQK